MSFRITFSCIFLFSRIKGSIFVYIYFIHYFAVRMSDPLEDHVPSYWQWYMIFYVDSLYVLILAPTTRGIYLREASACRQLSEVMSVVIDYLFIYLFL